MEKEQHTAKLPKFLNSTHCASLERQVLNEKMNNNRAIYTRKNKTRLT